MRIGFILPDLNGGGAERVVFRLAGGLLERGHRVDLMLLRPAGPYRKAIPSGIRLFHAAYPFYLRKVPGGPAFLADAIRHGLLFERLPASPWRRHRAFRALRRHWPEAHIPSRWAAYGASIAKYLLQNQPDVVLASLPSASITAIFGKVLAGTKTPIAISIHSNIILDYSDDDLALSRILNREADAIVAVSKGVAESAVKILGIPKERITHIPNPIPVEEIATEAQEPVEHPWFAEEAVPVVLTVGRAVPAKDHPTLVRALALLRRSIPARLVILCDLAEFEALSGIQETRVLAASLGIAEHVVHLDFDENPFRYMARASVLAMSSRWEGFPNVLLEAMACGTAVVSTDAPFGPREILENGRWGPLVPVGDADALAKALADILTGQRVSSEDLYIRAATFSPWKIVDAYENLFSSLLLKTTSLPSPVR